MGFGIGLLEIECSFMALVSPEFGKAGSAAFAILSIFPRKLENLAKIGNRALNGMRESMSLGAIVPPCAQRIRRRACAGYLG
jgi:hypothetical protein